jgi:hypothetical protein
MPIVNVSRASRDVPEPRAVNVDPARANAVCIPSAMPKVAAMAGPNVAIVCSSDDVVAVDAPVNVDVPIDVNVPVDVDIPVDVDVLIDLRSVCRCCDSEPSVAKIERTIETFLSMSSPPLFERCKISL